MDDALIARFWSLVDKDGPVHPHDPWLGNCWQWRGTGNGNGYGVIYFYPDGGKGSRTKYYAHRASWILRHGPIPSHSPIICHSCDRGHLGCVSPFHLFAGTLAANNADMWNKGRGRAGSLPGEQCWNSLITEETVRAVRVAASDGAYYRDIAKRFGLTVTNVSAIVRRQTWKNIPELPDGRCRPFVRRTKLSEDNVRNVRAAYLGGETQTSIAARLGVTKSAISLIVRRKKWKHVV